VIIVVAYAVLTAFTLPALPGFVLVTAGSLLATVALYETVVRRTNVTRFLFGMKPLGAQHPTERQPRRDLAHDERSTRTIAAR
jgi:hypothetical protein